MVTVWSSWRYLNERKLNPVVTIMIVERTICDERLLRAKRWLEGKRPQHDGAEHDVSDEAEPGHLRDRHRVHGDEVFCRGVEQGKANGGERHQADRFQSLAGIGNADGG